MTTNPITQVESVAPQEARGASAMGRWALSLLAVLAIAWVASRKTFFDDSISSVFLSVALFSIFLILVRTRFSWKEIAGVAAGAGLIYWLDIRLLGFPYHWPIAVSCVGIAALAVLALRAIWAAGERASIGGLDGKRRVLVRGFGMVRGLFSGLGRAGAAKGSGSLSLCI